MSDINSNDMQQVSNNSASPVRTPTRAEELQQLLDWCGDSTEPDKAKSDLRMWMSRHADEILSDLAENGRLLARLDEAERLLRIWVEDNPHAGVIRGQTERFLGDGRDNRT